MAKRKSAWEEIFGTWQETKNIRQGEEIKKQNEEIKKELKKQNDLLESTKKQNEEERDRQRYRSSSSYSSSSYSSEESIGCKLYDDKNNNITLNEIIEDNITENGIQYWDVNDNLIKKENNIHNILDNYLYFKNKAMEYCLNNKYDFVFVNEFINKPIPAFKYDYENNPSYPHVFGGELRHLSKDERRKFIISCFENIKRIKELEKQIHSFRLFLKSFLEFIDNNNINRNIIIDFIKSDDIIFWRSEEKISNSISGDYSEDKQLEYNIKLIEKKIKEMDEETGKNYETDTNKSTDNTELSNIGGIIFLLTIITMIYTGIFYYKEMSIIGLIFTEVIIFIIGCMLAVNRYTLINKETENILQKK